MPNDWPNGYPYLAASGVSEGIKVSPLLCRCVTPWIRSRQNKTGVRVIFFFDGWDNRSCREIMTRE